MKRTLPNPSADSLEDDFTTQVSNHQKTLEGPHVKVTKSLERDEFSVTSTTQGTEKPTFDNAIAPTYSSSKPTTTQKKKKDDLSLRSCSLSEQVHYMNGIVKRICRSPTAMEKLEKNIIQGNYRTFDG